jgi:hypothetical protein
MHRCAPSISLFFSLFFFIIPYMSVVSHRTEVMSMFNIAVTTVQQTSANLFQVRALSSFQSPYAIQPPYAMSADWDGVRTGP